MTAAHIVCRDCKLTLHVGKIRCDESGQPIGFWHGRFTDEELCRVIQGFLATHIAHDVRTYSDHAYDAEDWIDYQMILKATEASAANGRFEHAQIGSVPIMLVPTDDSSTSIGGERG